MNPKRFTVEIQYDCAQSKLIAEAICALLNGEVPEGYVKTGPVDVYKAWETYRKHVDQTQNGETCHANRVSQGCMEAFSWAYSAGIGSGHAKTPTKEDNASGCLEAGKDGASLAAMAIKEFYAGYDGMYLEDLKKIIARHCVSREGFAFMTMLKDQHLAASEQYMNERDTARAQNKVLEERLAKIHNISL